MKAKAGLAAVFAAGIAASFAVAAPSHDGPGKGKRRSATVAATTGTGTTATTRCRNVELRGTAAPSTFTMTVEKASRRARDVRSATVTFSGPVKVNARMCTTAGTTTTAAAATFELRVLKVRKANEDD